MLSLIILWQLAELDFPMFPKGGDLVTRSEVALKQLCCKGVEQQILNGPFERAGAELGIKAILCNNLSGGSVCFEGDLLGSQTMIQLFQLDINNL